jgi:hypothetical protein
MQWFHPIGGPVLLLPRDVVRRWRGQHPKRGFTPAYEAVQRGLADGAWVGLDIGGLALADQGPVGLAPREDGLRLVVQRAAPSPGLAEKVAADIELPEPVRRIPWPGGEGVLFDAVEAGDTLDGGLTEPVSLSLPAGPLAVREVVVDEGLLHLVILDVSPV